MDNKIRTAIGLVLNGNDLSEDDARAVMTEMMEGSATPAQMGAFLAAMRNKGETIPEITACAKVMREKCTKLNPETDVLDIVGTGGDELYSFNISTVSAFVIAAGGVPVAKHGGRSVSSKCGAADCLEALGANINITATQSEQVLKKTGMCFMAAHNYHAAMKHVAPVRKEMGARTMFNILGPLSNPAGANMQLLGVYNENLVEPLGKVLLNLGVKRAMVVHGRDGLDEITITGTTCVCEVSAEPRPTLHGGRSSTPLNSYFITPEQFGLKRGQLSDITGGDPTENAEIARNILSGKITGAKRDIVVLNAGCCLYMAHNYATLRQCVNDAAKIIDSGKAYQKLEDFVSATNNVT
ncbi:MAG: anthranilate phosphoribosyltransferase [Oscillospiraceae bacterium]|jgi:anthranilate phosphoribosyltransferase|nr:anthranilate phosphoribosyltransferase [Oscillospiraceae bacterium]